MAKKRVLVGYGIDVDAVSGYLNTTVGKEGNPDLMSISRGIFGATRGVERLLQLWDDKNIKCSWFVPGHTLESFPYEIAKIRDGGHEIGLHGYTHEYPARLTRDQFEATLVTTIDLVTKFTGARPKGFTAPAWDSSPDQIELLEKYGLEYDHSFMHDDFHPYYAPYGKEEVVHTDYSQHPDTWMVPMKRSLPSSVVEIPGWGPFCQSSWALDDWPPLQCGPAKMNPQGYTDPYNIERQWREQFEWCYRHFDTFIFPISIHPQVSGRPNLLLMHERLIDWINGHEGVEWCTFAHMAAEFRAGKI